jgi:hypothetical protein
VNRRKFILAAAVLAATALWLVQPTDGYQLAAGEAELDTVSIGKLEIGMPVKLKNADTSGTVIKFIRRDEKSRSAELAVVQWADGATSQRPTSLTELEPVDGGGVQVAGR